MFDLLPALWGAGAERSALVGLEIGACVGVKSNYHSVKSALVARNCGARRPLLLA